MHRPWRGRSHHRKERERIAVKTARASSLPCLLHPGSGRRAGRARRKHTNGAEESFPLGLTVLPTPLPSCYDSLLCVRACYKEAAPTGAFVSSPASAGERTVGQ